MPGKFGKSPPKPFNWNPTFQDPQPSYRDKSVQDKSSKGVLLWYGIIDLDTGKKKNFTTRKAKSFNLNGHRWLLISGHGFFDIISHKKIRSL